MEIIVGAAESLIRGEGVSKLNMRSLAAKLGVQAPSLYTYFSDLDEIVALALERIVADIRIPDPESPEPPAGQLIDLFIALRNLVRSAPMTLICEPGTLIWRWNTRIFNQLLGFYYRIGADRESAVLAHRMLWALALDSVFRDGVEPAPQQTEREQAEIAQMKKMPEQDVQLVMDFYLHRPSFACAGDAGLRERLQLAIARFLPEAISGKPRKLRNSRHRPQ